MRQLFSMSFRLVFIRFHGLRQALGVGNGALHAAPSCLHGLEAAGHWVSRSPSARKGWEEFNTSSRSLRDLPLGRLEVLYEANRAGAAHSVHSNGPKGHIDY